MTEMVTSGSMSGEEKRSDGLLGERSNERRRAHLAPPVLYATALLLDSTRHPPIALREDLEDVPVGELHHPQHVREPVEIRGGPGGRADR
jgi:hypothetical protein